MHFVAFFVLSAMLVASIAHGFPVPNIGQVASHESPKALATAVADVADQSLPRSDSQQLSDLEKRLSPHLAMIAPPLNLHLHILSGLYEDYIARKTLQKGDSVQGQNDIAKQEQARDELQNSLEERGTLQGDDGVNERMLVLRSSIPEALKAHVALTAQRLSQSHLELDTELEKRQIPYLPLDLGGRVLVLVGKKALEKLKSTKADKAGGSFNATTLYGMKDNADSKPHGDLIDRITYQADGGDKSYHHQLGRRFLDKQAVRDMARESAIFVLDNGLDLLFPLHDWIDPYLWNSKLGDKTHDLKTLLHLDTKPELQSEEQRKGRSER